MSEVDIMGLRDGLILATGMIALDEGVAWAVGTAALAFALSLIVAWRRLA